MKPGDKCVYIGTPRRSHPQVKSPKRYEEVVLKCQPDCDPYWVLYGYEYDYDNDWQGFHESVLVPLDDWKQAEYMVEELKEELEVTV